MYTCDKFNLSKYVKTSDVGNVTGVKESRGRCGADGKYFWFCCGSWHCCGRLVSCLSWALWKAFAWAPAAHLGNSPSEAALSQESTGHQMLPSNQVIASYRLNKGLHLSEKRDGQPESWNELGLNVSSIWSKTLRLVHWNLVAWLGGYAFSRDRNVLSSLWGITLNVLSITPRGCLASLHRPGHMELKWVAMWSIRKAVWVGLVLALSLS